MHSAGRHSSHSPDEPQEGKRKLRKGQYASLRTRRLFSRKRKFTAGLLAAICPGLGHIYLGLYRKGISFIFILLLDASALLYFSSIGMQINVPLLILLGLLFPVAYFYSVYDVLQAADYVIFQRKKANTDELQEGSPYALERSIAFGVMLVTGGLLMFAFYQKPRWLSYFIEHYGHLTVASLLVATGLLFAIRESFIVRKQRRSK